MSPSIGIHHSKRFAVVLIPSNFYPDDMQEVAFNPKCPSDIFSRIFRILILDS